MNTPIDFAGNYQNEGSLFQGSSRHTYLGSLRFAHTRFVEHHRSTRVTIPPERKILRHSFMKVRMSIIVQACAPRFLAKPRCWTPHDIFLCDIFFPFFDVRKANLTAADPSTAVLLRQEKQSQTLPRNTTNS